MTNAPLRYPISSQVNSSVNSKKYRTVLKFYDYQRYVSNSEKLTSTGTVILPLPANYSDNNSIQTNSGFGLFTNLLTQGSNNFSGDFTVQDAINKLKGQLSGQGINLPDVSTLEALKSALSGFKNVNLSEAARNALSFVPTLSGATGQIFNPHTTLFFEGVDLKSYQLEWKFSPYSQEDVNVLKKIERFIKQKIHPARNGIFLEYPDMCTVRFKNVDMNPIRRSFVTNFNMNFGSNGQINLYKTNDASYPIVVNLSMAFTEIEIRTSEFYEGTTDNNSYTENDLIKSSSLFSNEPDAGA